MSDAWLQLIPTEPEYVPAQDQIDRSLALIRGILSGDSFAAHVYDSIELITPSENQGCIYCPGCNEKLNDEWWRQALDRAARTGLRDRSVETPCCEMGTTLDALKYDEAPGFARFGLEVLNPSLKVLPLLDWWGWYIEIFEPVASALDCDLKMVRQYM